jgi:hypothetical protein
MRNRSPALRHARVLAYIFANRKENPLVLLFKSAGLCHGGDMDGLGRNPAHEKGRPTLLLQVRDFGQNIEA